MTGRSCRRKGVEWERAVARRLVEVFGKLGVRRGLQYRGGDECPDVITPALWVECKAGRLTNPRAALKEATKCAARKGLWPVAICKDDKRDAHVTMGFEDFLALLGEWQMMRSR
jgi:hypothetical protein